MGLGLADLMDITKLNYIRDQLKDIPTEELVEFVEDAAEKMRQGKIKRPPTKYGGLIDVPEDSTLAMSIGAFQIIEDRKGKKFAYNLVGYRFPRTLKERFNYFFTGVPPLLETSL